MAELMMTETILQARFGRKFEVEGDMSALTQFVGGNLLQGTFLPYDTGTGQSMGIRFWGPVGMMLMFDDGTAETAIPATGFVDHTYAAGDANGHPWIHSVTLRDSGGRHRGWRQFEVPAWWSSPQDIAANPANTTPLAAVTQQTQPLPAPPATQQPAHRRGPA